MGNTLILMARNESILTIDEMKLSGRHNYMNALAAIALAQAAGVNLSGIQTALREFGGLEHRFQLAHMADGVRWINDSKATNVGSTVAALTGLQVKGNCIYCSVVTAKAQIFPNWRHLN